MNIIEFTTTCKFRSLTGKAPVIQTPYQLASPLSKKRSNWTHDLMINIAILQMAASSISHRLWGVKLFLTKEFCRISTFEFCHILSVCALSHFRFLYCQILSFWVLSHTEFCHFCSFCDLSHFEFCQILSIWVLSHFNFFGNILFLLKQFFYDNSFLVKKVVWWKKFFGHYCHFCHYFHYYHYCHNCHNCHIGRYSKGNSFTNSYNRSMDRWTDN